MKLSSINFIKENLNEIVNNFPYVKCSYGIDEFDETHIIKVTPKEYFELDEFLIFQKKIIDNFIKFFPEQGVFFISDNDDIDIENVIYETEGILYKLAVKSLTYNFADIEIFDSSLPLLEESQKITFYSSHFNDNENFSKQDFNISSEYSEFEETFKVTTTQEGKMDTTLNETQANIPHAA